MLNLAKSMEVDSRESQHVWLGLVRPLVLNFQDNMVAVVGRTWRHKINKHNILKL
jgi:hypothetical protein